MNPSISPSYVCVTGWGWRGEGANKWPKLRLRRSWLISYFCLIIYYLNVRHFIHLVRRVILIHTAKDCQYKYNINCIGGLWHHVQNEEESPYTTADVDENLTSKRGKEEEATALPARHLVYRSAIWQLRNGNHIDSKRKNKQVFIGAGVMNWSATLCWVGWGRRVGSVLKAGGWVWGGGMPQARLLGQLSRILWSSAPFFPVRVSDTFLRLSLHPFYVYTLSALEFWVL